MFVSFFFPSFVLIWTLDHNEKLRRCHLDDSLVYMRCFLSMIWALPTLLVLVSPGSVGEGDFPLPRSSFSRESFGGGDEASRALHDRSLGMFGAVKSYLWGVSTYRDRYIRRFYGNPYAATNDNNGNLLRAYLNGYIQGGGGGASVLSTTGSGNGNGNGGGNNGDDIDYEVSNRRIGRSAKSAQLALRRMKKGRGRKKGKANKPTLGATTGLTRKQINRERRRKRSERRAARAQRSRGVVLAR